MVIGLRRARHFGRRRGPLLQAERVSAIMAIATASRMGSRMAEPIVEEFLSMSTATVSDAMDRLGIAGQCLGIKPLDPRTMRLCGRAFTVRMIPAETPAGSVGDYIDDVEAGQVVVLDNQGRQNATVWGDILTAIAHRMGVAGTVIDGNCRDAHLAPSGRRL